MGHVIAASAFYIPKYSLRATLKQAGLLYDLTDIL